MRRGLPLHYPFVAAWVLVSALGFAVSGVLAGRLAASGGELPITLAPSVADGIRQYGPATMAALSTWGAGLGTMQWIVVRGRLEGAGWWAPATVTGWGVAGAVIGSLVGGLDGRQNAGAHDAGLIGVVHAHGPGTRCVMLVDLWWAEGRCGPWRRRSAEPAFRDRVGGWWHRNRGIHRCGHGASGRTVTAART